MEENIKSEKVFISSNDFFSFLLSKIDESSESIDMETYILSQYGIGAKVLQSLMNAAKRGVQVRLLVDGFGSYDWIDSKFVEVSNCFSVKVFHPLPFLNVFSKKNKIFNTQVLSSLFRLNKRNHKKVVIIDGTHVFLGSHNMWDNSLKWKEVGFYQRPCFPKIQNSFEYSWDFANSREKGIHKRTESISKQDNEEENVYINFSKFERKLFELTLIKKILRAKKKVWLMTPYFVPPEKLLRALCRAAKKGVDVTILLPYENDHFFMKLIARYFYPILLNSGVKICEYKKSMLHGKVFIIDEWSALGSTNLNHRSFFNDLELMVKVSEHENRKILEDDFKKCSGQAILFTSNHQFKSSLIEKIFSYLLLGLRSWI